MLTLSIRVQLHYNKSYDKNTREIYNNCYLKYRKSCYNSYFHLQLNMIQTPSLLFIVTVYLFLK